MMLDELLATLKPKSVIQSLREKFPDEGWRARRAGFGWMYENARGELAYWVTAMAPRYDGDDDTFVSEFWIYRKSGAVRMPW